MQFKRNPTGWFHEKLHKMAVSFHMRWYEKYIGATKSKSN